MSGFSGFKKDDPPSTELEIMSTARDMISSGANDQEVFNYINSASDGESGYDFNGKGDVEASGPNGRTKLTKENETLGLWDNFKPRNEGVKIL